MLPCGKRLCFGGSKSPRRAPSPAKQSAALYTPDTQLNFKTLCKQPDCSRHSFSRWALVGLGSITCNRLRADSSLTRTQHALPQHNMNKLFQSWNFCLKLIFTSFIVSIYTDFIHKGLSLLCEAFSEKN